MKFSDRVKLASHNMYNSKSRTILTILIVFIVSLLIQIIGIACINFATNINKVLQNEMKESGSYYHVAPEMSNNSNGMIYPTLQNDQMEALYKLAKEDTTAKYIIYESRCSLSFDSLYSYFTPADFRMPISDVNFIEGRGWSQDDTNTNAIFLEESLLSSLTNISIGDTITVTIQDYNDGEYKTYETECVIKGIFVKTKAFPYSSGKAVADSTFLYNLGVRFGYANIVNSDPPSDNMLFAMYKYSKIVKNYTAELTQTGIEKYIVSSSYINDNMMSLIMNAIIIGLGIIIGFIVLLLSIGSIANTMIISIDKNKKFTGLMMAMGLKPKNIKSVIRLESAMTIIAGVLLSTIVCLALIPVFNAVLGSLFQSLLFYEAVTFRFSFPFYFPIGVSIVFILMAMLFTRAGVSSLVKQDPITVISEVG